MKKVINTIYNLKIKLFGQCINYLRYFLCWYGDLNSGRRNN